MEYKATPERECLLKQPYFTEELKSKDGQQWKYRCSNISLTVTHARRKSMFNTHKHKRRKTV